MSSRIRTEWHTADRRYDCADPDDAAHCRGEIHRGDRFCRLVVEPHDPGPTTWQRLRLCTPCATYNGHSER